VFCLDKLLGPSVGVFVWLCSPILGPCSLLYARLQTFNSYQPQPQRYSLQFSFAHVAAVTATTTISFWMTQRDGVRRIPRHSLAWYGPWVNDQGRSKTLSPSKPVACLSRFTNLVSPLQRLAEFKVKVAMGIPMRSRG
jgi:hypothetical protein